MNVSLRKHWSLSTSLIALGALCAAMVAHPQLSFSDEVAPPKASLSALFSLKANTDGSPLPNTMNVFALGKTRDLTFEIQKKPSCFFGDLDVILVEASWAGFNSLRISLEPLDNSKIKGVSQVFPIKKLADGPLSISLRAPSVTRDTLMGVFICSDQRKSGSCKTKEVVPAGQVIKRYAPDAQPEKLNPKRDIQDKVYYFNHVIVGADQVASSQNGFDKTEQSRLEQIVKGPKNEGEASLLTVNRLHFTLTSVPLKQEDNRLKITLPISDFPHCGG